VLLATVGGLYPGLTADGVDAREAAEVKGHAAMVDVLAAAVRDRQRVPEPVMEIEFERETLRLDRRTCTEARTKARRSRRPHNQARRIFVAELLQALTSQVARRLGEDLLDPRDLDDIRAELAADVHVVKALDSLWPVLAPEQLLGDLWAERERLDSAAVQRLSDAERVSLLRPLGSPWTPADVPLLDELAELLGEDDTELRAEEARREREERAYAEGVLDILEQDDEIIDEEVLRVSDVLDAELFAERQQRRGDLTAAQRAAQDRTWTFGHVIVDEAQELSAMDWRLLMRRCPSRSMTLVGDVAQTGAPGGATSWDAVLSPYVEDRWRLEELTVNYRTPAEIACVAADVLAELNPELCAPIPVRETGVSPWRVRVEPDALAAEIRSIVDGELDAVDGGTVAVLCPVGRERLLSAALDLDDERVSVLAVDRAKGLEFDAVVLVAPDEIVAESPRGLNDLYVALTRATRRLGLVQTGDDLPVLSGVK
jgi:DNA helicase IV